MSRLFIALITLLPTFAMAHPSDYPNGVDPKAAKVNAEPQVNSQAYEAKKKSENEFSWSKFWGADKKETKVVQKEQAKPVEEKAPVVAAKTEVQENVQNDNVATNRSGKPSLKELTQNKFFKQAIDLALLGLAMMSWFGYMANFDPRDAFMKCIHPAILTFLAFQWTQVFRWFNL